MIRQDVFGGNYQNNINFGIYLCLNDLISIF